MRRLGAVAVDPPHRAAGDDPGPLERGIAFKDLSAVSDFIAGNDISPSIDFNLIGLGRRVESTAVGFRPQVLRQLDRECRFLESESPKIEVDCITGSSVPIAMKA